MKKNIFILVFIFITISAFCQVPQELQSDEYPWRILEKAEVAYDKCEFGQAIKLIEQARINHKRDIEYKIYTLQNALKPRDVQRVGDNIQDVLQKLEDKKVTDATKIIREYMKKYSSKYFNNSISNLVNKIENSFAYPESDYLIGKIYIQEGEFSLAKEYLDNAYQNKELLDISDVKFDILYTQAYLAKLQNDFNKYESYLLLIIEDDEKYITNNQDQSFLYAVENAILNNMNCDKFFLLYRCSSYKSISAYFQLSSYYQQIGKNDSLMRVSAMGTLTSITRIEEILKQRILNYKYTNLETFFKQLSGHNDITQWGIENDVWKGFYQFAESVIANGKTPFAFDLLSVLSLHCPEPYWKDLAKNKLIELGNLE